MFHCEKIRMRFGAIWFLVVFAFHPHSRMSFQAEREHRDANKKYGSSGHYLEKRKYLFSINVMGNSVTDLFSCQAIGNCFRLFVGRLGNERKREVDMSKFVFRMA